MSRDALTSFGINTIKLVLTACLPFIMVACSSETSHTPTSAPRELKACTGFGCTQSPGKLPSRIETHKATKDEKIRARRGESPDFGSGEGSVSGPLRF